MASRPLGSVSTPVSVPAYVRCRGWVKRSLLQPIAHMLKVVSGQSGHEEVKRYIAENETIQSALVTRIRHLESRVRVLTILFVALAAAEVLRWVLR